MAKRWDARNASARQEVGWKKSKALTGILFVSLVFLGAFYITNQLGYIDWSVRPNNVAVDNAGLNEKTVSIASTSWQHQQTHALKAAQAQAGSAPPGPVQSRLRNATEEDEEAVTALRRRRTQLPSPAISSSSAGAVTTLTRNRGGASRGVIPSDLCPRGKCSHDFKHYLARLTRRTEISPKFEPLRCVVTRRLAGRAERLRLLYVGPHNTVCELKPEGILPYSFLSQWSPWMVFFDANPTIESGLHWRLRVRFGAPEDSFQFVLGAACKQDGDNLTFYVAQADLSQLSIAARRELEYSFSMIPHDKITKAIQVRCYSPKSMLQQGGIQPKDLDVLLMDAEGLDFELMRGFLKIPGFRPVFIQFEWIVAFNGHFAELVALLEDLVRRGYKVHHSQADIVAVDSQVSGYEDCQ